MKKSIIDATVEEKIRRVRDAMAQEGLVLDEGTIKILSDCLSGKMTFDEARLVINKKYESGGLGGK